MTPDQPHRQFSVCSYTKASLSGSQTHDDEVSALPPCSRGWSHSAFLVAHTVQCSPTLPSASSLSTSVQEPCIWNCVMSSVIKLQAYPMLMAVSCRHKATGMLVLHARPQCRPQLLQHDTSVAQL